MIPHFWQKSKCQVLLCAPKSAIMVPDYAKFIAGAMSDALVMYSQEE